MKMSKNIYLFGVLALTVFLHGCYTPYTDKSKRNKEYAPNMYTSLAPEAYSQTENEEGKARTTPFANGLSAQLAPEGTVPRTSRTWYRSEQYEPFNFGPIYGEFNNDNYELAGEKVTISPLFNVDTNAEGQQCSSETYTRGKELYEIYCVMCHGANGQGKGKLVTEGVFGNVPSYSDEAHRFLPPGKMYYSITYGKGIMGSYASQLTPKERWQVICYIQDFQDNY
ncbi:MAG: cytochrome c [Bacteroidota bacterium]